MNINLRAQVGIFESLVKSSVFTEHTGQILDHDVAVSKLQKLIKQSYDRGGHLYLIGNGGSAAVASHINTDFCNIANLRALTLHDSSILTCLSNDYGYENAFAKRLDSLAKSNDILIAISSSGESANMLRAAEVMMSKQAKVVTFTGFKSNNPLRKLGALNCWVKSAEYGLVEICHLFILHYLAECMSAEFTQNQSLVGVLN